MECIKTNWLGNLFSTVTEVQFDETYLRVISGSKVILEQKITEIIKLPSFKKGILGFSVSFSLGKESKQIKFLNSKKLSLIESKLISSIAQSIQNNIDEAQEEFILHTQKEFLRDSNIERLDNWIGSLIDAYMSQKEIWKLYIEPASLAFIEKNSQYFPLISGAADLRKSFEKTTLKTHKKFYDTVENNPLTSEQRLAVVRDNDRNLVLAAAGTGKTSVMVAKTLDLICRKVTSSNQILILAYNKSAATELQERLEHRCKKVGLDVTKMPTVVTFHALGRKILNYSKESVRISNFCDDPIKLKNWLSKWFKEQLKTSPDFMKTFIDLSYQPVNPFDFKTKKEYDAYIRDNEYRTLQGERVKGYQELLIANWFYLNGINYEYEPNYIRKRRIEPGFDYKPDFYLEDANVYLEHFGIARDGSTRPDIDKVKYNQDIANKRKLHLEYETTLIETYHYNWTEGNLESVLEKHVLDIGLTIKKRDNKEVFEKLKESGFLINGVERYLKCLQAIRVEQLSNAEINNRLVDKKIVNAEKYTKLLADIHNSYQKELNDQEAIDFDDMIIKATLAIANQRYKPKWSHILVDEFQDISGSRMQFLEKLVEFGKKPILTVVGDDWQSIYRFSGGKLELTTQFEERVGSCTKTMLQKTFRYNNSIAEVAGTFVMQNPEQYKKNVITHEKVNTSQVYLLDSKVNEHENLHIRTVQIVQKILQNDPNADIAVLARYRYLLKEAKAEISANHIQEKIKFWTFHGSKGLEADYCILIGFFQGKMGFPNENKEEAIVEALLPTLDSYPHSEERRLLYVGITRAKKKSYLIADPMATSEFIVELLSPKYNLYIASKTFEKRYRKMFKCSSCSDGYFKLKVGKYGNFYSCTTGEVCNSKPRICTKCGAPSIDGENSSICTNPSCQTQIKICNKCGRPMNLRNGKFGEFWGCSGYGVKDDQCKNTARS